MIVIKYHINIFIFSGWHVLVAIDGQIRGELVGFVNSHR